MAGRGLEWLGAAWRGEAGNVSRHVAASRRQFRRTAPRDLPEIHDQVDGGPERLQANRMQSVAVGAVPTEPCPPRTQMRRVRSGEPVAAVDENQSQWTYEREEKK